MFRPVIYPLHPHKVPLGTLWGENPAQGETVLAGTTEEGELTFSYSPNPKTDNIA